MRRWLLVAGVLLVAADVGAFPVDSLVQNGPSANRIDLVILGDGYRDVDQAQMTTDATALVTALFGGTPYREYAGLFNVKLVHVVSVETGADLGTYGSSRETALGANYWCQGTERLLCVDTAAAQAAALQDVPEYDTAVVLVNDPKYGGSGGTVPALSINPYSADIGRHELGHVLGLLADEYDEAYPGYPNCPASTDCPEPNATLRSNRPNVKWTAWIPATTPVPTLEGSGYTGIGLFEGCRYQTSSLYRPSDTDCLMKELSKPFCAVCSEGMVRAFWNKVSPVDSATPATTVSLPSCAANNFSVSVPTLATPSGWAFAWTVDGAPNAASGTTLALAADALAPGAHTVTVVATDITPLVRVDPSGLLKETRTWAVAAMACTNGGWDAGAADAGKDGGPSGADAGADAGRDGGPDGGPPAGTGGGYPADADGGPPLGTNRGRYVDTPTESGPPESTAPGGCGCGPGGSPLWLLPALAVGLTRLRHGRNWRGRRARG